MKDLRDLDEYRFMEGDMRRYGSYGGRAQGVFVVPNDPPLRIIADTGQGWDHVSVSCETRTPTWEEMDRVKRLFFKDTETAMQLHVPPTDHINIHPNCLHLWRPKLRRIPTPQRDRV